MAETANQDKPRNKGQYKKGQSGNPNGRPKGLVDWRTKLRAEIKADLPGLLSSLMEQAKAGDTAAAKLLLDRSLPTLRPEARQVENFQIVTNSSVKDTVMALAQSALDGRVPVDVAMQVGTLLLRAEQQQAETGTSYEDELKRLIGQDETQESD